MTSASPPNRRGASRRLALRVTLLYLFFGLAWILFSDQVVARLFPTSTLLLQSVKGMVFVVGTAALLYPFTLRMLRRHGADRVRLARLWQVLQGVRRLHALVTGQEEETALLRRVCRILVEDLRLDFAWIALEDPDGGPMRVVGSGDPMYLARLQEQLGRGETPPCVAGARADGFYESAPPHARADEACLPTGAARVHVLAAALRHEGTDHGVVVGGVDRDRFHPGFLRGLFGEVARDVAFARTQHAALARERGARARLQEREALFRAFFEAGVVGLAVTTPEKGWLLVNDRLCEILGRDREELERHTWAELTHPDDLEADVERFQRLVDGRGDFYQMDKRFLRPDGSVIHAHIAVRCIRRPDGSIDYFVGLVEDISARVVSQEELAEKSALLTTILERIPVMIGTFDAGGELLWTNPAWERTLGWTEDDRGRLLELCYPDPDQRRAAVDLIAAADGVFRDFRTRIKSGTVLDIAWANVRTADGGTIGIGQDITERKRFERELQASEGRLRRAVEQSPLPAVIHAEDGEILHLSRSWLEITGYRAEDLPTVAAWAARAYGEDAAGVEAGIARLFQREERVHEGEFRVRCADGTVRLWDFHTTPLGRLPDGRGIAFSLANDVTERRRAEEEHRRLHAAIEQIPESVVITDPDGSILYVNPAFEQLTGYARAEALGRNPSLLRSGEQSDGYYRRMWETISAGRTWTGEFVNLRKDGTRFVEESVITPIKADGSGIVAYVAVKRDVTGEKEAEEQLRQSQKMEALGTLAGGIAHDFNNILQGILGYATLVQDDLPPGSEPSAYVDQVLAGVERARELVRQILTFSRRTEQARRPLLLAPVVKEALKLLRGGLPAHVRIEEEIAGAVRPVLADPGQVHQIVMNLGSNAGQAMAQTGGVLTVRLAEERGREGPEAVLTVQDTGVGMDQATLERVFEPYFTTRLRQGGTGLGLSVVHGIVAAAGGSVTATSRPGAGSTFVVRLPVHEEAPVPEPAPREAPAPARGRGRILFVDDEAAITDLARRALGRLGWEVETRTSSLEALELFRHAPRRFDAVVTDMTMPNMLGTELARRIRELREDVPILICTGFSELLDEERARRLGIDRILHKPVSNRELAAQLDEAIARRRP